MTTVGLLAHEKASKELALLNEVCNRMSNKDGGPAFPKAAEFDQQGNFFDYGNSGMTLRDWFAGQALAGTLLYSGGTGQFEDYAKQAYMQADAMLAARETSDE